MYSKVVSTRSLFQTFKPFIIHKIKYLRIGQGRVTLLKNNNNSNNIPRKK